MVAIGTITRALFVGGTQGMAACRCAHTSITITKKSADPSHAYTLCPPQVAHLLAVCSYKMALESHGLAAAQRPAWRSTVQQHLVATALTASRAPEELLAAIVDADELKQALACACGVVQQPRAARREEVVKRTERKAQTRSSDLNAMLCTSSADSTRETAVC
jgi:hypothetical protein